MTNVIFGLFRVYANSAILDGQLFAIKEEKPIVELLTTLHLK
jgi:hypothetical protein